MESAYGPEAFGAAPRAPLGHLAHLGFALAAATDVDGVVRAVLADLTALPGVRRVGLGLVEGGGRRLQFVAAEDAPDAATALAWCHIDAYDDVPLTAVVRTGEPILSGLDGLEERYAGLVARQRAEATEALAAVPLPGSGSPVGGLVLFFTEPQRFDDTQWRLLEATARRTAEALRRVRAGADRDLVWEAEADPPATARAASLALVDDPRASGAARRFLRHELEAWAVEEDVVDTAELCLSELVTNAVVHAGTTSELRVRLADGVLTVVVRDRGGPGAAAAGAVAAVADPDPLQVHGRGLMLVEALADRWGSERDTVGTTVWFALDLGADHAPDVQQTG